MVTFQFDILAPYPFVQADHWIRINYIVFWAIDSKCDAGHRIRDRPELYHITTLFTCSTVYATLKHFSSLWHES